MSKPNFSAVAVIPAAGIGMRMATKVPKQYLSCLDKPVLWHSLNQFQCCDWIEAIYVCLSADDRYWNDKIGASFAKVTTLIGGKSRAESVSNGLKKARQNHAQDSWVLVHDAARPCLFEEDLNAIKKELLQGNCDGLILADKVADTVKEAKDNAFIANTIDRSNLWRAQTPQVFRLGDLAIALAAADLDTITDEASAMEQQGKQVKLLQGDPRNIKVTQPADLALVELYLKSRALKSGNK